MGKIIVDIRPNPKQLEFFKADTRFVAYGGSRGGGKSWSVRQKAKLLALNYAGIKILILRRTYPELRENHILPLMADLKGLATYRELDKSFNFPNGSRIRFDYLASDSDALHYQGQELDIIFLDEATQFSEYQYSILTACLRGANDFPKRMYLTANPGGVGHEWVKRLFIDKQYRGEEKPEEYTFIRASVYDNTALMDKDKGYVTMLENLPEGLRQAWLYGDWDVLEGRYFNEFDRNVHVKPYRDIPSEWNRYVTMDYGLDKCAVYWIAVDYSGRAFVYKELYESDLIVSDAAKKIKDMTTEKVEAFYAPPDLWNRHSDTGQSTAEIFANNGVPIVKTSNNRIQGWMDLKEWLKVTVNEFGEQQPGITIFDNCSNLIRCLPQVVHDPKNPNDISNEPHELTHSVDALRYFCAGRPRPSEKYIEPDEDYIEEDEQIDSFISFGRM